MRRRRVLGIGGIALVSGCLRLQEGTGENSAVSYPAGLSPEGASRELVATHRDALAEQTFGAEFSFVDEVDGRRGSAITVGEEATAMRERLYGIEEPREVYHDGTDQWWRMAVDGDVWFGRSHHRSGGPMLAEPDETTLAQDLEQVLRVVSFGRPTIRETEAGTRFELSADGVADPTALGGGGSGYQVDDVSATLVADADGIVRSHEGEFTVREGGDQRQVTTGLSVTDVGEASVSPPSWLGEAQSRAPDLRVTLSEDRRRLTVGHEGGDPIPAETSILLEEAPAEGGPEHRGRVGERIESGDELHLWPTEGGLDWAIDDGQRGAREFQDGWLFRLHLEWIPYLWALMRDL